MDRPDATADELTGRAVDLLADGEVTRAEEALRAALLADPLHPTATYDLGLLRWRRGETTDDEVLGALAAARTDGALVAEVERERGAEVVLGEVKLRLRSSTVRIAAAAPVALSGDEDGVVTAWDLTDGAPRVLHGERWRRYRPVPAVAVGADGTRGAAVCADGAIRVWDLADGRCLATLDRPPVPAKSAGCHVLEDTHAVRLSADGRSVLWAANGTVRSWRTTDDHSDLLHAGAVFDGEAVDLSADGRLAVYADDGGLRVWQDGRARRIPGVPHGPGPVAVVLGADGRLAAVAEPGAATVTVWELASGRRVATLRGHVARSVSLSQDGRFLLSAGGHTLRYWELAGGRCLRTFRDDRVVAARFGDDPGTAVSVRAGGAVRTRRLPTGGYVAPYRAPAVRRDDEAAGWLAEAERATAAGRDTDALHLLTRVRARPGYERAPRALAAWRALGGAVTRVGLREAWPARTLATGRVAGADLAGSGDVAATCAYDGTVQIWDVVRGGHVRTVAARPRRSHPIVVALSPDGRRLLTGEDDTVRLWSVDTGECLRAIGRYDGTVRAVEFTADGARAYVRRWGGPDELWELATGELVAPLRADAVAWDRPDGPLLAASMVDGVVWLTGLDGALVRRIEAHSQRVGAVSLTPDGRSLLTSGGRFGDETVRLWDTASGELVRQLAAEPGHQPCGVRFTADPRYAVGTGRDCTVHLWDVRTGGCLGVVGRHDQPVERLAVDDTLRYVLSWCHHDGARVWELDWALAAGDGRG
ncbi:WD40 repeat domain-containing protein [Actinocatenispora rupis]|uniref:WD40 repeat n=1 Tax=Actinocatenispora rupis TaxID=519421 RepID=A0A8J3J543_9ACTN|nr:WD40 repeat domain-containing protein [Actinocatenispora rupis]GID12137.1 hypothetical protein Aru02nite_30260 [Actinocatenispora rupis]